MIKKYHNHKLHVTPGRQTKQSIKLSLSLPQNKIGHKVIKHITITESYNGSNNQQRINNNRSTALE